MNDLTAWIFAAIHVAFEFIVIGAFLGGLIFAGGLALHLAQ